MSRDRRRREEATSSQWPEYSRSHYDDHGWRPYAPPTDSPPQRRSFNYWRDEPEMQTPYPPPRSYTRESHDRQWRFDDRERRVESSYPRQRHNSGRDRYQDDRESWRDRGLPHQSSSRQLYPAYTVPPRAPHPTLRATRDSRSPNTQPVLSDAMQKASPSQNKSSQTLKPSPEYLSLSQQPSEVLHDPALARKLLVLDLNGTLLIRSARSRVSSGPRLRAVQPRPYMQSFRYYLFCPETKGWLDTMVWSSAQPHSVEDMVDKIFGATRDELKAVWNRKSLGLSEAEYHQKAVTTKDLTKPWSLLASAISPENPEDPSQAHVIHSTFTTLLLDDSPHKAVLQPYNHVCIPEYSSKRRQHDLQSLLATKEPKKSKQDKKAKQKNRADVVAHPADIMVPELSPIGAPPELAEKEPYDATLLAVIGILEDMKRQSNVAGWIRKGGLWAAQEKTGEVGALDAKPHSISGGEDAASSNTIVQTGNDASITPDTTVTTQHGDLQTRMWFDDSSVVAYWAARGRRTLTELGIHVIHGVTG